MKSIYLCETLNCFKNVYSEKTTELLAEKAGLDTNIYNAEYVFGHPEQFDDTEYIFSTWGMPTFTEEEIKKYLPKLKCVFYAAGSVQYFARPFLKCGVKVFSAWAANAIPVAEYAVAQIILANKGFYLTSMYMSKGNVEGAKKIQTKFPGNFGKSVGIIGAGMIGSIVCEKLKAYNLRVKVFDPFLSDERALELGVKKCSLEELFSTCQVVSNHLANNEQTKGMLKYEHFSSIPTYGTFVNTGRGAQVVEADLIKALSERDDLTAVLDVTDPMPPIEGHKFYTLKNCFLTPHIAGSGGDELQRMAEYMTQEYLRMISGENCRYEVSEKMLETMA